MSLAPPGAHKQFSKLDKQSVIGALKSTGSRDPDVLHAQKSELLAPAKHLKLLGLILMVGGGLLTLTVILAIAGLPLAIFGWWCWNLGRRNIATIETGCSEYLASVAA